MSFFFLMVQTNKILNKEFTDITKIKTIYKDEDKDKIAKTDGHFLLLKWFVLLNVFCNFRQHISTLEGTTNQEVKGSKSQCHQQYAAMQVRTHTQLHDWPHLTYSPRRSHQQQHLNLI